MATKKAVKKAVEPKTVAVEEMPEPATVLDVQALLKDIHKTMGIRVFEPENRFYLKTHWPVLDRTIGTPQGIPYTKMVELSGPESHGKSVIQSLLFGEAQRDSAVVIKVDAEDSNDELWNVKMGVDNDSLILLKPKIVIVPLNEKQKSSNAAALAKWKELSPKNQALQPFVAPYDPLKRPQSAEEIFDEVEKLVYTLHRRGVEKMVVGIDSMPNLSTEAQLKAGAHQNMRTVNDLPMFLSGSLKRWQVMMANFNVLGLFVNHIREKPGVMFGDPTYEPCGRALRHNCASRNRCNRKGPGKIFQNGKLVGINGILKNMKNKTGEGSLEQQLCEYKIMWDNRPLHKRVSFETFIKKEKTD